MASKLKQLSELKGLQEALAQAAREREQAQREEQQRRARELQEANIFRNAMQDVKPLAKISRVTPAAVEVEPQPRQRLQDEAQVLRESVSDDIDVDTLLDTDDGLSYRAPGIGPDVVRKLRRGAWAIQAQIDLHGYRVDEARVALLEFLRLASRRGQRCVRVVHGKGLGSHKKTPVLKGKVRGWLVQKEEVIAFCQARAAEGGSGALIVLLRPPS